MALRSFFKDESGAVTVDWVVLTGAIIGISMSVIAVVSAGANATADTVGGRLTALAGTNLSLGAMADLGATSGSDLGADNGGEAQTTPSDDSEDGTQSADSSGSETDSGSDSTGSTGGTGNPGNDKDVGKAGENPNGSDDWGSGSKGRSG